MKIWIRLALIAVAAAISAILKNGDSNSPSSSLTKTLNDEISKKKTTV